MIERGTLAPFRIALLPPGDRDEWYSASAVYGRSLCRRIIPAVGGQVDVAGRPVGMGTSLGALAMLQAQRSWPERFAGLFLQSGSFFVPALRSPRVGVPAVRSHHALRRRSAGGAAGRRSGASDHDVRRRGGEHPQQPRDVSSFAAQGYPVRLHEVADLHNYTSWRDAFDPYLTRPAIARCGPGVNGVASYGHWGRPVLAFPAERGDAGEFERRGMVGAIGELLAAGA